jgi:hypothetical protein
MKPNHTPRDPEDEMFKGMPEHVKAVHGRYRNLKRAQDRKKFMESMVTQDKSDMNPEAPGTQHRA